MLALSPCLQPSRELLFPQVHQVAPEKNVLAYLASKTSFVFVLFLTLKLKQKKNERTGMPVLPISPGGPSGPSLLCKLIEKKPPPSGDCDTLTKHSKFWVPSYLQANQRGVTGTNLIAIEKKKNIKMLKNIYKHRIIQALLLSGHVTLKLLFYNTQRWPMRI